MKLAILCAVLTLIAHGGSCNSAGTNSKSAPPHRDEALATGIWGGQHIQAEVTNRGAEIEFDCAHGSIPQQISLDNSGQFDANGTYSPEHAGPIRDDENSSRPVRYKGNVKENSMSLTIADARTKEIVGTFTLTLGNDGRIMKCR
ncbi:MAG: hypothetical protein ABR607_16720 [Pyrinomonadaceae bacterium]